MSCSSSARCWLVSQTVGALHQIVRAADEKPRRRVFAKQIAGELFADELVVRLVVVERANDVIAIRPGVGARRVHLEARRLGESAPRPANAAPNARRSAARPATAPPAARKHRRICPRQKRATSSGVGGRPIKSKLNRRISVRRSASGESVSFSACNRARMKASMGLRREVFAPTEGTAGRVTGLSDQCNSFALPSSGQFAP